MTAKKRTLIIGLGNPILGDDGIGWKVAEEVQKNLPPQRESSSLALDVDCIALGGISLMERMIDYDFAIVIDSIQTHQHKIGDVLSLDLAELPDYSAGHTTSVHDTSLATAVEMGKMMGSKLPDKITIIGIEAQCVYEFSEQLSPEVEAAIPIARDMVMNHLNSMEKSNG